MIQTSSKGYLFRDMERICIDENDSGPVAVYKSGRAIDLTIEEIKAIYEFSLAVEQKRKGAD